MKALLVVVLLGLAAVGARAQDSAAVVSARQSYEELRYDEASALLEAALADAWLSEEDRLKALELKGIVDVIRGEEPAARASFRALLEASPDATLPVGLSPKITRVFDEVRRSMPAPSLERKAAPDPVTAAPEKVAAETSPVLEDEATGAVGSATVTSLDAAAAPGEVAEAGISPVAVGVAVGAAVGGALLVVGAGSLLLFARASPPESSLGTLQLP